MDIDRLSDESCSRRVALTKKAWDYWMEWFGGLPATPSARDTRAELVAELVRFLSSPEDAGLFPNGILPYVRAVVDNKIYG